MTPKKINIAIIGFGNIGSYFYKILEKNKKTITTKTGKVPFVKYISAKSISKKRNIKIGVLGGTFDPAHKGHLAISRIAKKKIKLKYIIWSITRKNPFKKRSKINVEERIEISKKITKKDRFIKIEFLENKINSKKTIDLIRFLKKINTTLDIFFIMGADNLIKFHKWNRWKEIVKLAKILVFDRQGYKSKSLNSIAAKKMHKDRWKFIKLKKVNISSSQIRKI